MLGHVCHLHIHFRFKMQWIVLLSMLALAAAQCQPRLSPTDTLTVPSGTLTTWSEAIHAAAAPLAANVDGGFYVVVSA